MKAAWVESYTDPATLQVREVPSPVPGPQDVKLAVHSAGLNFGDMLMAAGRYQIKPPLPFAPGMEVAGVVSAVGAEVHGLHVGDRVFSMCGWGAYADEVCIPASMAFPVHDAVSLETAAIFPIAYGTVYHTLVDRAALRHDEWLVVHGAGSGVGLVAVEMGRLLGARVIAVAGSDARLDAARRYGAEVVLDHRRDAVRERVLELTGGRGADVIFDPVGGDVFDGALRYIATGGRLLVIGFASGTIAKAPTNILLLKGFSVVGVNTATLIRDDLPTYRKRFEMMMRWVADGRLAPLVGARYRLDEIATAMADLRLRKHAGKPVIRVGGD